MDKYVYLVGADDAKTAGYTFERAAHEIRSAVSEFGEYVRQLESVLAEDRAERERADGEGEGR